MVVIKQVMKRVVNILFYASFILLFSMILTVFILLFSTIFDYCIVLTGINVGGTITQDSTSQIGETSTDYCGEGNNHTLSNKELKELNYLIIESFVLEDVVVIARLLVIL